MAASIFSVVSLGFANLMVSQNSSTAYLQDQLLKVQMQRNIESVLLDATSCENSLAGLKVKESVSKSTKVSGIKNNQDDDIYESNTEIGFLEVGQLNISNDSVAGPSSTGFINLTMPIHRKRLGGGPSSLAPLEFKLSVNVDVNREITTCTLASGVAPTTPVFTGSNCSDFTATNTSSDTWHVMADVSCPATHPNAIRGGCNSDCAWLNRNELLAGTQHCRIAVALGPLCAGPKNVSASITCCQ